MTTFFLVRHAAHALLDDVLTGRRTSVGLSDAGSYQARLVARRLSSESLTEVQSSPQPRARETAAPIAQQFSLPIEITSAIDEIEYGEWTGRRFAALASDPLWTTWNTSRENARPPAGESIGEVRDRVLCHFERAYAAAPDARVVMVSHAEVIRTVALHVLGFSADEYQRLEIAPASITTIEMGPAGPALVSLNEVVTA